jgi:lipopolysaccharide transport system ATP-binding protein
VKMFFLNAAMLGLSQKETALRFSKISEFADIGDFIDQPVKTYSSGMYVRLAFAVIAHVDADILIIDEALAVGDIFFTQKCMRFLKNFQKTGSIIFVTHDTSSVLALCDKAVWLNKGKLMSFGDAKTTCEAYLSDYYSLYRAPKKASHDQSDIESVKDISRSDFRDCRQDQINNSTIRTDLEFSVFSGMTEFQQDSSQVDVEDVVFLTRENQPIKWFVGGELITLKIVFKANVDIERPIVGFLLKDKLGQALFGDNTFISYVDRPVFVQKNAVATAKFYFRMPVMPAGEYTLGIAVASGTQEEHVMHTWVHDALVIKSHSKNLATGLLGIPMVEIELTSYVR